MLLSMKSMWQNTCLFEKILIGHKRNPQDDHSKLFFVKKVCKKKVANKIRWTFFVKKEHIRVHANGIFFYTLITRGPKKSNFKTKAIL